MRDYCTCDIEYTEPHPCPFAQDVHNDPDSECNCCEYCTYQCALDI